MSTSYFSLFKLLFVLFYLRRYPAVLALWIGLCSMFVSVAALITVPVGGLQRSICTWDDTPKARTISLCKFLLEINFIVTLLGHYLQQRQRKWRPRSSVHSARQVQSNYKRE